MSKTSERRADIINYLYFVNDRTTTPELARMFDVGLRTMERDIAEISLQHHIVTEQGRKGGIRLQPTSKRGKFSREEFEALYRIWHSMEECLDREILHSILCRLGPSERYI